LLKRVGEETHQSSLVLTSREKPKEFAPLEENFHQSELYRYQVWDKQKGKNS
jgi:hypothetical protein